MKFSKLFVAGTFDNFHIGHQFFLWNASSICKRLIIIISRDINAERIKGRKPKRKENLRLERIQKENIPNATIRLGRLDGDFFQTLREEAPDALLLGYDQKVKKDAFQKHFPNLHIMRAEAYFPEYFKSSKF